MRGNARLRASMRWSRFIAAGLLAVVAGCGGKTMTFLTAPEPPIVWPKPPDQPRVRYVGELKGSEDIGEQKSFGEVFDEVIYGPKPPARLVSPQAVAVNAAGDKVAVADVNGKCVHVFDLEAHKYTALVQVGFGGEGGSGNGTDERPARRRGADAAAKGTVADGAAGGGAAASRPDDERRFATHTLESPIAVCWAGDRLWVADSRQHALALFEPSGAGRWIGRDKLVRPAGMAYSPSNQLCYVSDAGTHRILAFDKTGELLVEFGSRGGAPGQFNCPSHMACGPDGSLVVADSLNFRVQRLGGDGSPIASFGRKGDAAGDLALPKGVAVDASGVIWVVDAQFENVQAFTPEGGLLMSFGREGHGPGEFWLPAGICIDGRGRMWVADRENARVQVFALLP